MSTGSPSAIATPPTSVGRVAVRMNDTTGDDHRSISSTALGTRVRSARSRSHCPG